MSFDKFTRWAFFCAGIITAIFAGYMFYVDEIAKGAACLAVCVGFLSFATRFTNDKSENENSSQNQNDEDTELHDLAVLVAELATMSLQNIGRTVPATSKEISDMEEKLNKFLASMPLNESELDEINEKFEAVKNKNKRGQSGRAMLLRSSRL